MANNSQRFGDMAPSAYPGERLGLPASGSGSVARVGRRLVAICIDWALALLIARLLPVEAGYAGLINLAVFVLMQVLFISTIGGSIGHRLLGMRLLTLRNTNPRLGQAVLRTLLLAVVIPALVWDSDQRAFHDKISGTVLVKS